MARYDQAYAVLAKRAVDSTVIDIEAFIERARGMGVSIESLTEQLLADFETGGPLFGRYLRKDWRLELSRATQRFASASSMTKRYRASCLI